MHVSACVARMYSTEILRPDLPRAQFEAALARVMTADRCVLRTEEAGLFSLE